MLPDLYDKPQKAISDLLFMSFQCLQTSHAEGYKVTAKIDLILCRDFILNDEVRDKTGFGKYAHMRGDWTKLKVILYGICDLLQAAFSTQTRYLGTTKDPEALQALSLDLLPLARVLAEAGQDKACSAGLRLLLLQGGLTAVPRRHSRERWQMLPCARALATFITCEYDKCASKKFLSSDNLRKSQCSALALWRGFMFIACGIILDACVTQCQWV